MGGRLREDVMFVQPQGVDEVSGAVTAPADAVVSGSVVVGTSGVGMRAPRARERIRSFPFSFASNIDNAASSPAFASNSPASNDGAVRAPLARSRADSVDRAPASSSGVGALSVRAERPTFGLPAVALLPGACWRCCRCSTRC